MADDIDNVWSTPTLVPAYEMGGGPRSGQGPAWKLARDILNRLPALSDDQALRYPFPDPETASVFATRATANIRKDHGNGYISTRTRTEDGQAYLYVRRGPNYGGAS